MTNIKVCIDRADSLEMVWWVRMSEWSIGMPTTFFIIRLYISHMDSLYFSSCENARSPVEMVWWVRMTEWTIPTSSKSFIMLFFISQIQSLYFNSTSNTQTVVSYTGPTNRFSTKGWIPVAIIWWVRTTQWSIQTSSKSVIMRF